MLDPVHRQVHGGDQVCAAGDGDATDAEVAPCAPTAAPMVSPAVTITARTSFVALKQGLTIS